MYIILELEHFTKLKDWGILPEVFTSKKSAIAYKKQIASTQNKNIWDFSLRKIDVKTADGTELEFLRIALSKKEEFKKYEENKDDIKWSIYSLRHS